MIDEKKRKWNDTKKLGIEPNVPLSLCDKIIDYVMKTNSWTDRELHDELATIFIGVKKKIIFNVLLINYLILILCSITVT